MLMGTVAAGAALLVREGLLWDRAGGPGAVAAVADMWVLLAGSGAALAVSAVIGATPPPDPWPVGLGMALAVGALAASDVGGRRPWRLRVAAVAAVLGVAVLHSIAGVGPGTATWQRAVLALLLAVAALATASRQPVRASALALAAGTATLLAAWSAPSALALAGVLVVLAAQLLGAAVGTGRLGPAAAAILALAGAWGLAAPDLLRGLDPAAVWVALPFAVAVLAECELGRFARQRGAAVEGGILAAGEWTAVALVLGPVLSAQLGDHAAHSLVGVGLGAALLVWAVLTRVRRRLALSGTAAVLPLAALVAVPLLAVLPALGGIWLWALLACCGFGLVAVATGMERGRRELAVARGRLDRALAGWE
jgi:hypothetical protein